MKKLMATENKGWFAKAWQTILSWFHTAEDVVEDIVDRADQLVDVIKNFEASAAGQLLQTGLAAVWPASSGLINAFRLWLPKISAILANIQDIEDLTDEEKLAALLEYLAKLKTSDPVLYAGTLNTLNASIQQFFATNEGVIQLTPQASLAAAQVAHDETLGGAIQV